MTHESELQVSVISSGPGGPAELETSGPGGPAELQTSGPGGPAEPETSGPGGPAGPRPFLRSLWAQSEGTRSLTKVKMADAPPV